MTEGKNFKRLVRERMRRTGESYTTARRQVLARAGRERPAWPAAVVPGYTACGGGEHHDSTLLAHVLDQAGVKAPHTGLPYGEAMLAGLGGGLGFMYAVFEYGEIITMTVVTQHHPEPFLPAALARTAVPYEVKQTGSAKVAERALRAVLDSGRPAVCRVDRARLPWHPSPMEFGDAYEVAVIGLDGANAHVDDECVRPNLIPFDTLMGAWSRHKKGRHHLLHVTGRPQEIDLAAAITDAISTTVAHLTGPVLGHSFDVNFGLSGMRKLVDQLGDQKKGWQKKFGTHRRLFTGLTRLHAGLEIEYGAPGAMRPLYARFLDEAAPLVSPRLAEAAELYRESGQAWSAVASTALAPLPRYDELVEEALAVELTQGAAGAERLAALCAESMALEATFEMGEADRRKLFDELADHAARALSAEERAAQILAQITG